MSLIATYMAKEVFPHVISVPYVGVNQTAHSMSCQTQEVLEMILKLFAMYHIVRHTHHWSFVDYIYYHRCSV